MSDELCCFKEDEGEEEEEKVDNDDDDGQIRIVSLDDSRIARVHA